jgi:hypothetical protein
MSDQPLEFQQAAKHMFAASADDRGTVQALAQALDEVSQDGL